jgi:hypothetical protein
MDPMTPGCASWEPIHGFATPGEYERFRVWIAERVADGTAQPIEVESTWGDVGPVLEEWYRCPDTGEVWRLVHPDPPSRGLFDRVDPARRQG